MQKALSLLLLTIAIMLIAAPSPAFDSADSLSLAFKLSPGTTAAYRIHQRITGSRFIPGSSVPTRVDLDAWSKVKVQYGKPGNDGVPVEVTIEPSVLKLGGSPADSLPAPRTVAFIIGKDGRIPEEQESSAHTTPKPSFAFGTVESVLGLLVLPDHPVSVGDTWTIEFPQDSPYLSRRTLVYTLESVKTQGAERIAGIGVEISKTQASDSPGSTRSADSEGSVKLVFSLTRGILASASGTVKSPRTENSSVLEHCFDIQRYDIAPSKTQ